MRIAFLTPQYPSEYSDGGGLGSYVHRMARLLAHEGHEPEVFVSSNKVPEATIYDGVRLHRVNSKATHPILHFLSIGSARITRLETWRSPLNWILQATTLAAALERRHEIAPFRLVQSADWIATGLFVRRRPGRVHFVRSSADSDLYREIDRTSWILESFRGYMERLAMRRADLAYAPSRYLAEHFRSVHNINVRVLRPPMYWECSEFEKPPFPLPSRFFLHFGQLRERKGTALLAEALPIAWKKAPDLTMVWSGDCPDERKLERWRSQWGERASQVHMTGPLRRSLMYSVLRQADAAILPSLVDNLPNTVIESLMLGVPVLGSRGASIDELIEEGRTGHLVALGDARDLADAMVRMWLGESSVSKGFDWRSEVTEEMRPERAVANLIALANAEANSA